MRTVIVQNCNKKNNPIFDHLSTNTKNIWNIGLFVHKFFGKYKNKVFQNIFLKIYQNINEYKSYADVNQLIKTEFQQYLKIYSDNYNTLKTNQSIIYNEIIAQLNGQILNNFNYFTHLRAINRKILQTKQLVIPEKHEDIFFYDISDDIFCKLYSKNFFDLKYQMNNNIPFKINNNELIKNVKENKYLFKNKYQGDFSCKQWINDILYFNFIKNNDPLLEEINHYNKYLELFKASDLELIHLIQKIKIGKNYNYYDNIMLQIILNRLSFLTKKIKNKNIITNNDFFKYITPVEIQTELAQYALKYSITLIPDVNDLQNVCNFILDLVKNIDKELDILNKKLNKSKEILKNRDFIMPIINIIRYTSIENDWDAFNIHFKKLLDYVNKNKPFDKDLVDKLNNFNSNDLKSNQIKQKIFELTKEMISELKLGKKDALTSDRSMIDSFTRINIEKCDLNDKIPSDVINNTLNKLHDAISSFYALKKLGNKNANFPKYLGKNDKCNVKYLNNYSMTHNNKNITIFVGKHINNNYNDFVIPTYACLKDNVNHSKYANFSDLTKVKDNKVSKKDNFVYSSKSGLKYYIDKESSNIIDGGSLILNIPGNMYKIDKKTKKRTNIFTKIIQIEVIHNKQNNYDLHITYEPLRPYLKIDKNKAIDPTNDGISIDLGMINLMTIYDPKGYQKIVKGGNLLSINHYFNKIIEDTQSQLKKLNNEYISKKIIKLYKKRENVINNYFNMIVKWLFEEYKNKKIFVIGYNVGWKDSPKMNKRTRKIFCQIPYRKLLTKIHDKGKKEGILIKEINESYTSKCDALKLEEICFHEKYLGKRLNNEKDKNGKYHRGLFLSGNGKCINSDLNGAINIMRKYCKTKEFKFEEIKGNKIYNPEIVRIEGYSYKINNPKSRKDIG